MPYNKISQLPDNVKNNLPVGAKKIYLKAYNSAFDQYEAPEDRKYDDSREEVAHKVAWSAVKKKYKKEHGDWVEK